VVVTLKMVSSRLARDRFVVTFASCRDRTSCGSGRAGVQPEGAADLKGFEIELAHSWDVGFRGTMK
jgi:hypothetical protein